MQTLKTDWKRIDTRLLSIATQEADRGCYGRAQPTWMTKCCLKRRKQTRDAVLSRISVLVGRVCDYASPTSSLSGPFHTRPLCHGGISIAFCCFWAFNAAQQSSEAHLDYTCCHPIGDRVLPGPQDVDTLQPTARQSTLNMTSTHSMPASRLAIGTLGSLMVFRSLPLVNKIVYRQYFTIRRAMTA